MTKKASLSQIKINRRVNSFLRWIFKLKFANLKRIKFRLQQQYHPQDLVVFLGSYILTITQWP